VFKNGPRLNVGEDGRLVVDVLNLDGQLSFSHEIGAVPDLQGQGVLVHLLVDQGLGQVDVADLGIVGALVSGL